MTADLPEEDRERADAVRRKRREREDPEDRVRRVQGQTAPPEGFDVPEAGGSADLSLPAPLRRTAEETRKKLTYGLEEEYGVEMDAEDHYWPLVVHLGVERLKGMWLEEVTRTMETAEDLEAPGEE